MSSTSHWSLFAIFFQSFIVVIVSWLVLTCRLVPSDTELDEVTLMKLLYLYDPVACERTHFYNYTAMFPGAGNRFTSSIFWPEKNDIAASFRSKIRLWLSLHLLWCILGVANLVQQTRPCGFYFVMIPFTVTGLCILVMDFVFAILFYVDAKNTGTELDILKYIDSGKNNLHTIKTPEVGAQGDTSWIAVVFAYCSIRGVMPWFINFWVVKDLYFNGLDNYHRLHSTYKSRKSILNSDSFYV